MMFGLKSFFIKQPKKRVMQLSAKKTQLLSLNYTSCHLSVFSKNFLQFVTATDRIPVLGFDKKIEVFLTDQNLFLRSSTCGLILYLKQKVTKNMFETALIQGLSFGII